VARSTIRNIIIALIIVFAIVAGRWLYYYSGFYQSPSIEIPDYSQIVVPSIPSSDYTDSYEPTEGSILLDLAHANAFELEELNVLIMRLISRGLTIDFLNVEDSLEEKLLGVTAAKEPEYTDNENQEETAEVESTDIEDEIESSVKAFIVVCPQEKVNLSKKVVNYYSLTILLAVVR
jgi:hypothetical protein